MKLTPMMRQYYDIKKQYPDSILFFRLGDFYEMFGEDAKVASKVLEIALTSRDAGPEGRVPMCGIPHHAAEGYLDKLVRNGFRVALCEQLEDPKKAKGVVKRDVVRVITPGTFIEGSLNDKENQYLTALSAHMHRFGLSALDMSTGEFLVTSLDNWGQVEDELVRLHPVEIVIPSDFPKTDTLRANSEQFGVTISTLEHRKGTTANAAQVLMDHFNIATLTPLGLDTEEKITAAGLALQYVQETQRSILTHITKIQSYSLEQFLHIDGPSRQNLELTRTIRDGRKSGSLLGVIDYTKTSMGGRLLRAWLEKPLVDISQIEARQEAVSALVENTGLRLELTNILDQVYDLQRLAARLALGSGNARDLVSLRSSLEVIPTVKSLLSKSTSSLLSKIEKELDPLTALCQRIGRAIVENPPISLREGNLIRDGYNENLDDLRSASRGGKEWIRNLETSERKKTGIKSLKVGFNRVFGYYIEVTNPNLHLVPDEYQRKQTLTNAERYITPELKEKEALVLGADERIADLEYELFLEIREDVREHISIIQGNAQALAALDVLQSLATAAVENNYVRPTITNGLELNIKEGRHPVIEKMQAGFVPNDVYFDENQQVILLTGPNMAGKSTYLRQVALIVIMAQMGSYVPASKGTIGLVDRIFTRIGAADDLSTGQSTFMVECSETAYLLLNATERSLIILDELGRGTSTFDGMAIAQAVIEHIHNAVKARTLFSTHFHELTKLENTLPRLATYRVEVEEKQGTIYFLHQVSRGSTDRSYGINVARMAGIPKNVLKRALELLQQLEAGGTRPVQLDLFRSLDYDASMLEEEKPHLGDQIIEELLSIDVNNTTPLHALQILWRLQKTASSKEDED